MDEEIGSVGAQSFGGKAAGYDSYDAIPVAGTSNDLSLLADKFKVGYGPKNCVPNMIECLFDV